MTNPKHKFFRLNLTQQLVGIVLLLLVGFLSFFFIFINKNINYFVNIQIEEVLKTSQNNVIDTYRRSGGGSFLLTINSEDPVNHKIWQGEHSRFQTKDFKDIPRSVDNQINTKMQQLKGQPTGPQTSLFFHAVDPSENYNILMTVNSEYYFTVVSTLSEEYSTKLRSAFVNGILRAIFLIVLLIFSLLMAWVTSIIRSLNKIQDYVNDVVQEKDSSLEVNRQDEIGEVAKALVYMNEELKRQEKVKEELIQNISHDLKTPIATIKSYGESIKDGVYPYDTLEKSVDVIIEHAGRLEQKVHSLLLLNRMDYLVANNDGSKVDLKDVMDKTIVSITPINSNLEIISDTKSAMFVGEEESWRVVFENILDNALRYAETYIKITLDEDHIEISNDGKHLTKEVSDTMFKAYEKGTDGGFGMGLSIVKRVVDAYGYHVSAENTEDGVKIVIKK